ncbi:MAG TPA: Rad52/Rad22 family DNA repair protein [Gemmatimonadaceae bacterium]|nr:Rad52/Rad22 family DNA repair protein [Gemmatimonadaceae bacterium]
MTMIARHEAQTDHVDVWEKLAAPIPAHLISWRQDGRPLSRDGRSFARFVAYIEANTVRERLDSVVPGEWNLTLELMPALPGVEDGATNEPAVAAFKARLQILGVVREDVGTGRDYKSAATDAFKRAAVRFGIGNELYSYEQNWVPMDGDGRSAKPLEDPAVVYERRRVASTVSEPTAKSPALSLKKVPPATDVPPCPKCGGRMWDNRIGKRNPRAPDFKCRDRACDGVIWPPKPAAAAAPDASDAEAAEQTAS